MNNDKYYLSIIPNSERYLDLTNLPNEIWKDLKYYEGLYQVSNYGRVKSLRRTTTKEHIMKIYYTKRGYCRINLYKNKHKKNFFVHLLVMNTFGSNKYQDGLQVNHKDENKWNNHINNLEWCDNLYNIRYGTGIERSKVKKYKPVLQYSLSDDFIKEYKSIQDASISVTNKHNKNGVHKISDCAKGYIDSYMGFKWKFKECEETQ